MIRISSLYSLDGIQDYYYLEESTLKILNAKTGTYKSISVNKRGYPVVYLQRKVGGHQQNVPMHKIVALALIRNASYDIIEHINDNKMDYRPQNLLFSNQTNNALRSFDNKKRIVSARIFVVTMTNKTSYIGTMRKISQESGVSMGTLYDNFLYRCSDNGICPIITQKKTGIYSIVVAGQQTIERHGEYVNRVE